MKSSKPLDQYPEMMNVDEVAEYLRIHKNTAYTFIKTGKIPFVKIGRQIRVYREDLKSMRS